MTDEFLTRRDFLRLALGTAGAAGLAAACTTTPAPTATGGAPAPATAAPRPNPVNATVKAGSVFALASAPAVIGIEQGYFQQAGITIDLQQFNTIANEIPLHATGQLDVALDAASSAGFFNAFSRGAVIKMVANEAVATDPNTDRPYYGLVVAKPLVDAGQVKRVSDLKGLPVSVLNEGVLAQL